MIHCCFVSKDESNEISSTVSRLKILHLYSDE